MNVSVYIYIYIYPFFDEDERKNLHMLSIKIYFNNEDETIKFTLTTCFILNYNLIL